MALRISISDKPALTIIQTGFLLLRKSYEKGLKLKAFAMADSSKKCLYLIAGKQESTKATSASSLKDVL